MIIDIPTQISDERDGERVRVRKTEREIKTDRERKTERERKPERERNK